KKIGVKTIQQIALVTSGTRSDQRNPNARVELRTSRTRAASSHSKWKYNWADPVAPPVDATSVALTGELVAPHARRLADRHAHAEVLVGAQASSEVHVVLAFRELPVGQQAGAVGGGVHRVVRLVLAVREARDLAHDHGPVGVEDVLALRMEVLELVDARE